MYSLRKQRGDGKMRWEKRHRDAEQGRGLGGRDGG